MYKPPLRMASFALAFAAPQRRERVSEAEGPEADVDGPNEHGSGGGNPLCLPVLSCGAPPVP